MVGTSPTRRPARRAARTVARTSATVRVTCTKGGLLDAASGQIGHHSVVIRWLDATDGVRANDAAGNRIAERTGPGPADEDVVEPALGPRRIGAVRVAAGPRDAGTAVTGHLPG